MEKTSSVAALYDVHGNLPALEAVLSAAAELGASVESTELVGLAPLEAILDAARYYLGLQELESDQVLETRLYGPSAT